jgi:hypothetical protein
MLEGKQEAAGARGHSGIGSRGTRDVMMLREVALADVGLASHKYVTDAGWNSG